jgi:hypothetical protein
MNQLGQLEGIKVRPIPRAKKQVSSLVNIVLSNDPRWNIYPRPEGDDMQSEEAKQLFDRTASRMSQWFSDLWYFMDMKDRVRELVSYGFKYGVGYAEVGADSKGNIFIDTYEPYDIWHEPGIKSLKETSVIIKTVSRTLEYIRTAESGETEPETDPQTGEPVMDETGQPKMRAKLLYDPTATAKLQPETKMSLSDWKDIKLKEASRGGSAQAIQDPRIARAFLKECWIKDGDHWDLITESQGQVLREEHTESTEHPFVAYKPLDGLLYKSSPYYDLISLNQAIDIQLAMLEGYARTTAVARFLKPKMTKMNRVLNDQGEVIEYEGSTAPQWLQPGASPQSSVETLTILKDLMDEIGTSVVSFGKVPAGVKAAHALEMLKNIEYANNQTPIDLLSSTLEEIAEKVLDQADRCFTDPVTIHHMTDGSPDFFQLVSASNSLAAQNPDSQAIPVSSKYMVKVEIESGAAFTGQGQRDTAMELFQVGLLPPEEVLKAYKYSNIDEIVSRLAQMQNAKTSITDTPEFQQLPPQLQGIIMQFVQQQGGQTPAPTDGQTPPAPGPQTPPAPQPTA